jgi:hypothetical protein
MIIIFNFVFLLSFFLESSDRLSSPKLSVKNSSSPLPSSLPPAASSRPSNHLIDANNTILKTSENLPHDETTNLKQSLPSSTSNDELTTPKILDETIRKSKSKREKKKHRKTTLSPDSNQRAKILLEILTKTIENRSKYSNTHPHSSYLGIQHYKDDQFVSQRSSIPSPDPYTNKRPPKSRRRSTSSNKNSHTIDNDTS